MGERILSSLFRPGHSRTLSRKKYTYMPELAEDTLLDVDAGTSGEGGNSDLSGDQGTQAPFLEVDERTKYATKEEALKGYKEAGQRIAELSRWEKELEPFGVKDPRVTAELLRELSQLRREQSARTAAAPKAVDARPSTPAEKLSEEETKARAWLRTAVTDPDLKSALIEQLGLKGATEQIAELKKQLETLSEGYKTDGETRTQSLVEDGESKIGSWLKEGGLDAGKYKFVASVVKNFLEAEQDRGDRFFRCD